MRLRHSPRARTGLLAWLLLLPALTACVSSPARFEHLPPGDERILAELRAALEADERVPADAIDVACREGVVTLTGFVEDPDQVRRALRHAARVDGVLQVVNRLRVLEVGSAALSDPRRPTGA